MSPRRILAVLRARNREFYRDKAGLGWNLLMPMLMILGFALLFSGTPQPLFTVGVIAATEPAPATHPLLALPQLRIVREQDLTGAVDKVRRHQLDLLLDLGARPRYWVNEASAKGEVLERLLRSGPGHSDLLREPVRGRAIRYVDWVTPGVLATNIMFSSLWGVGWVIVRYRKNGVLRRLRATPLTAMEFLVAQVLSRLAIVMVANIAVFITADLLLDFPMRGSYLALLLVFLAGSVSMISIGLLVAARLRNEEMADGILNLISWPMMIGAGVWFSLEGTHPAAQAAAQLLPLTHLVDAARAIMLDGAALGAVLPQIAGLAGLSLALLLVAARLFRWQ
jgi:ABC-type polysaccharide/polyol phosphate export permease